MAAIELKGRMLSATRLRVLDPDPAAIAAHLEGMARQMPQALQGLPVIVESEATLALSGLLEVLRRFGLQPIGVSGEALAEPARALGLAVLPPDSSKAGPRKPAPVEAPPPAPISAPTAERRSTRIVQDPVRGGQQVYAAGADLVVLHQVGSGAEVLADGCVHVYGRLAGRAIAGARGDASARIFCRRFEPELVAIAGVYAVAEQLQGEAQGKPAQVWLEGGKLKVAPLADGR